MADGFIVAVKGLEAIQSIEDLPKDIERWARMAVNKTATKSRARSAAEINNQVAFPADYLAPRHRRLDITKTAKGDDLEAVITGRHRPTSLARFAIGTPESTRKAKGVHVKVATGKRKFMDGAFLIRLRAGTADLDTKHNLGLAIRLKPGERLRNKKVQMVKFGPKDSQLYLLYGPSVDQIFRDVSKQEAPHAAQFMENEFLRLLEANV